MERTSRRGLGVSPSSIVLEVEMTCPNERWPKPSPKANPIKLPVSIAKTTFQKIVVGFEDRVGVSPTPNCRVARKFEKEARPACELTTADWQLRRRSGGNQE